MKRTTAPDSALFDIDKAEIKNVTLDKLEVGSITAHDLRLVDAKLFRSISIRVECPWCATRHELSLTHNADRDAYFPEGSSDLLCGECQ